MPVTIAEYLNRLEECGILSDEELVTVQQDASGYDPAEDARGLVRVLTDDERLTAYQARAVYDGKHNELVVGRYIVLDKLGEGGMGIVLKVMHRLMDRIDALKMLRGVMAEDVNAKKRFLREVKASAKVSHPNIVRAHHADEADGNLFLVMEFVDGRDLRRLVESGGPMSIEKAVDCVLQSASGMAHAHAQGIIHRDIKPANLLLDRTGTIKILDLGLARFTLPLGEVGDQPYDFEVSISGALLGTVDYLSPEQALDSKSADHRTDIYSLGCTLFYLLTGKPMFDGDTAMKKVMAHQNNAAPNLVDVRADATNELELIFQKMVAKSPDDRYDSMQELIDELESCGFAANLQTGVAELSTATVATAGAQVREMNGGFGADSSGQFTEDRSDGPFDKTVIGLDEKTINSLEDDGTEVCFLGDTGTMHVIPGKDELDAAPASPQQTAADQPQPQPLDTPEHTNSIGMRLRLIPAGTFEMGSMQAEIDTLVDSATIEGLADLTKSECPRHTVQISKPFFLGVVPVTQHEYRKVMSGKSPSHFSEFGVHENLLRGVDTNDFPVEHVSWFDAVEFCNKLSRSSKLTPYYLNRRSRVSVLGGNGYRLPTEAEWEYACRAGCSDLYCFGNNDSELNEFAWYDHNSGGTTHPVGAKKPNDFGLYDMHGNVLEWTADWFGQGYYQHSQPIDPPGPDTGTLRVIRGGLWSQNSAVCRSACRSRFSPSFSSHYVGIRVARTAD